MNIKEIKRPYNDKWIDEKRRTCKKCGHTVNFYKKIPYIECGYCRNLIFFNEKAEYDFKIKRRFKRR